MSDQFWLSEDQLTRISGFFALPHGVPRGDDHKVISGIIHVIRNGLRWRDTPSVYGPHKTLYNRFTLVTDGCVRPDIHGTDGRRWTT
ncbi:transposase [Rhodophyticola sp. CCM32]|nr:transposase [Rhodophyticola sp. CCM32]